MNVLSVCVCDNSSDTNHIESTEVSNAGLGRRPDTRTITSNVQTFKLFNVNE